MVFEWRPSRQQTDIFKAFQKHFKGNPSFETGERGTKTVMNATAKGQMARLMAG
jgi:hypothetical protein